MDLTLEAIEEAQKWLKSNKISSFYPDEGPLRRELYPKHLEFFRMGQTKLARAALSGNRTGKTSGLLCYEIVIHCLGIYPEWWEGRRFNHPVNVWLVGKTSETTRDILQVEMLGPIERSPGSTEKIGMGTGMIPLDKLIDTSPKAGVPGARDQIWIRHISGGVSCIGMKSYGKDRDSFEGTKKHIVGLDESPPQDVLDECVMRTMSTTPGEKSGMIIMTFTPLEGYTSVVKSFMESTNPDRWYTQIRWSDCPHLTPQVIEEMSRNYLPSQLKARSQGIPSAGEGAIYPIDIDEITVPPFVIPDTWPRGYAMDVGKTAALFFAMDPNSDTLIAYDEYYSEVYNTVVHGEAIKSRGAWLRGVIDPGSLGSSQIDGQKLFEKYRSMGLDLETADNAVESGINEVWLRLSSGRLKVFSTLPRFRMEFERYHRHEVETVFGIKNLPVKKDDHIMDCLRYMCSSGIKRMRCFYQPPAPQTDIFNATTANFGTGNAGWQVM